MSEIKEDHIAKTINKINKKKTKINKPKTIKKDNSVMPGILTIIIIIVLVMLILLMTEVHGMGAQDRLYIAQFSGTFSAAFGSACTYWFNDKKKKGK